MVGNIFGGCLFENVLTIWCSSLLEDARAILSVYNLDLAVCKSLKPCADDCLLISMLLYVMLYIVLA